MFGGVVYISALGFFGFRVQGLGVLRVYGRL